MLDPVPDVSVVVATRDRAALLAVDLVELAAVVRGAVRNRVLVV